MLVGNWSSSWMILLQHQANSQEINDLCKLSCPIKSAKELLTEPLNG